MRSPSTVLVLLLAGCTPVTGGEDGPGARTSTRFLPNGGQWPDEVQFAMQGSTRALLLRDGWAFCLERWAGTEPGGAELAGSVVRMRFLGAEPDELQGREPLPGRHHFLLGDTPENWVRNLPGYGCVRYRDLYPDIDLIVRGEPAGGRGGLLEYDLVLGPGADLASAVVECEGIEGLAYGPNGSLVMRISHAGGEVLLRQKPPVSWVPGVGGSRRPVNSRYVLLGPRRFGFAVEGWDGSEPLVVDPGLVWSTYLGGGSSDSANTTTWRAGEGVLVGGWAGSMDFPTTAGAFRETGMRDAFVTRLSDDGDTTVFSTYLGGSLGDEIRAIASAADGTVVVAGWTSSPDFPVTDNAFQPGFGGASVLLGIGDGFVTSLSADGSELVYSSFLGGDQDEVVEALDVDGGGAVVLVGHTGSPDFPITAGVVQPEHSGPAVIADAFVTRIASDGTLEFSTFLGGSAWDQLDAVQVDATGTVTACGYTNSADFPTSAGAFQRLRKGFTDAVVVRLDAAGRELTWSSLVGGTREDQGLTLYVDERGSTTMGGFTTSVDFPVTSGVLQAVSASLEDGFLVRLAADGKEVSWGTYFGGEGDDRIVDLAVDLLGDISVVGRTASRQFPISAAAPQISFGGGISDGFLARVDGLARRVSFATYHGGGAEDQLNSLDVSADGFAAVSGWTWSEDLPISPDAVQSSAGGVQDAMVAMVDLVPEPGWVEVAVGPMSNAPHLFNGGARFIVLAVELENVSPETARLESLQLLIAGVGDNVMDLTALRLYQDRNHTDRVDPGDLLVSGPLPFVGDNLLFEVAVTGFTVPAGGTAQLLVELEAVRDCAAGAEFTAAITDLNAWCLRTTRTRKLRMRGAARIRGPVHACGAFVPFAGDTNGDGSLDVGDLRRLARRLGEMVMGGDPDGDGRITLADLGLLADRLLTRPVLVAVPTEVSVPGHLTLQGHGLAAGSVEVTLGGWALGVLSATDRELVLSVDTGVPQGSHTLELKVGGISLPSAILTVR